MGEDLTSGISQVSRYDTMAGSKARCTLVGSRPLTVQRSRSSLSDVQECYLRSSCSPDDGVTLLFGITLR